MENQSLKKDIERMCYGKCYRCIECINDAKNGETEESFFCRFDDTQKNIIPTFRQVFQTMRKLAKDGIDFYESAVQEYINAEESRKKEMEKWLMDQIDETDFNFMSLETCLLLMMFPE